MRYEFIARQRKNHRLYLLCRVMEVKQSSYYAWKRRGISKRASEDAEIGKKIKSIFETHRGLYGSPRIHAEIKEHGKQIARKRVARLMREQGLVSRRHKRRVHTTDSNHHHPPAPNSVNRNFTQSSANRVYYGDITYIPTVVGFVYVAVVLEAFSRRVLGWHVSNSLHAELVCTAFENAIRVRGGVLPKELVFHSDRGSQYASQMFSTLLQLHGCTASMSRKGNCWDNAVMESFFHTLKQEEFNGTLPSGIQEVRTKLFRYIDMYYNPIRKHSALGYKSPLIFEQSTTHSYS